MFSNITCILFLEIMHNHCDDEMLWWKDQREQSDILKEDRPQPYHSLTSEISPNY